MLARADVACVELALASDEEAVWRQAIETLRPIAQYRDVAVVLRDHEQLAVATGCDGVVLSEAGRYATARRTVGDRSIVGVYAGTSRHEAMVAAERGADFVGLAGDTATVRWWAELMEVPCVAFGEAGSADWTDLARAGADFVAVGDVLWSHPAGPEEAITAFTEAITAAA